MLNRGKSRKCTQAVQSGILRSMRVHHCIKFPPACRSPFKTEARSRSWPGLVPCESTAINNCSLYNMVRSLSGIISFHLKRTLLSVTSHTCQKVVRFMGFYTDRYCTIIEYLNCYFSCALYHVPLGLFPAMVKLTHVS
jgi:hypothetical protein